MDLCLQANILSPGSVVVTNLKLFPAEPPMRGDFAYFLSALRPVILLLGTITVTLGLFVVFVTPFTTVGDTYLKGFLLESVPWERANPIDISELSCSCLN